LSIAAGLDQQMPDDSYFGAALKQAVDEGKVDMSLVDDSVSRILTPMFEMGLFDQLNNNTITDVVTSPEHTNAARQIGAESMVLLQNKGDLLPLSVDGVKIALIGMGSVAPVVGGGGSGRSVRFPSSSSLPLCTAAALVFNFTLSLLFLHQSFQKTNPTVFSPRTFPPHSRR
jgi:beta-glucosidase